LAGRIPESFIESLLERIDIVEVVGARLALRPTGRGEHKALCPFHDEKTPSFTVSGQKQFYHCFGCGAHGTAVGFLMEHDGLDFPSAIEELAQMAGLPVPREAGSANTERFDRLYEALASAQQWFRQQLGLNDGAKGYLKSRGFDKETVDAFGVGYAPEGWQGLSDYLSQQGFDAKTLEKAGLVTIRNGRPTDKFRDRVMFPIHDRRGRVIAFGGRALGDQGPKYMNSPETPVFHKGRELYRLYQVRQGGLPEQILVVEGYMDAAALHQFGFQDTVATLGTAVTADHLDLLFRATAVVIFCFDGDRAGRQAAWRGLETALSVLKDNREVRFLFLPEGEDPDTVVRSQGSESFAMLLKQAKPLSEFFFEQLRTQVDMQTLEGRARLVALAEPYLQKLPDSPYAVMMRTELGRLSGHQVMDITPTQAAPAAFSMPQTERPLTLVQYAVALLVQRPEMAQSVDVSVLATHESGQAQLKGLNFLRELIDYCQNRPQLSTAKLLELWRDRKETPFLAQLATREVCSDFDAMPEALAETLGRIRDLHRKARVRELQQAQLLEGGLDESQTRELRELLQARSETH
jgi:DNA primase